MIKKTNVRIAHIGCGYWGKNVLRNFAHLGALEAVVDHDPAVARQYAEKYQVQALPLQEALKSPDINAISIASPATCHAEHIEMALKHNKHVIVEKPLALKVEDGERLSTLANSTGKILMVGHLLQYHPLYMHLKKMTKQGKLGKVKYIYSNRMSPGKVRQEEDVLWSFAPHDVSMILGLVGEYPTQITSQSCSMLDRENDDITTVQFEFPSQIKGHLQVCWLHPFKEQRLVVIGEKATAVFEDSSINWEEKLRLFRHKLAPDDCLGIIKGEGENIIVPQQEPLHSQCQHFIECIEQNKDARTNAKEALAVLRFLCTASK